MSLRVALRVSQLMRCAERLHTASPQASHHVNTWRAARCVGPRQAFHLPSTVVHAGPAGPSFSSTSGQMDSELITTMTGKISTALETDRVNVRDVNGDGRHITVDVVSSIFEGKNSVQRQRLVYKAIWLELQEAVHAVDAMSTKTPAEVDS